MDRKIEKSKSDARKFCKITGGSENKKEFRSVNQICWEFNFSSFAAKKSTASSEANLQISRASATCGFYHAAFSTTISNSIFVTGTFDLFTGVRPVRQARFFFGCDLPERRFQHSSLSQSPLNSASLNYPYLFVCHQVDSQMLQNTTITVHAYFFHLLATP